MQKTETVFEFLGHSEKISEGIAEFNYKINNRKFTERLLFDTPTINSDSQLIKIILDNLSVILGVSYWKAFCPSKIITHQAQLSAEQSKFWQIVYQKGLGEFFYRNQLNFHGLVNFPAKETKASPVPINLESRALVFLGGGKDSLVTIELLRRSKKNFTLLTINEQPVQTALIEELGLPVIRVKRELDPQLLDLNISGKVYNGHVPFTAINSFIGLLISVLYDFRYLIMSNERSSNYGNLEYLGEEINHQWSKSFEFEKLFYKYVKDYITPGIEYFSLLRPFTELKIVKLFSEYPEHFHSFSSCNRNFRYKQQQTKSKWCGQCAKCAFIFLALAAFLPKETVINIFQKNLLTDETLTPVFFELLGLVGHKPFECVGTPNEVKYALYLIGKKDEYREDVVYKELASKVLSENVNYSDLEKEIFLVSTEHVIPDEFIATITNL